MEKKELNPRKYNVKERNFEIKFQSNMQLKKKNAKKYELEKFPIEKLDKVKCELKSVLDFLCIHKKRKIVSPFWLVFCS